MAGGNRGFEPTGCASWRDFLLKPSDRQTRGPRPRQHSCRKPSDANPKQCRGLHSADNGQRNSRRHDRNGTSTGALRPPQQGCNHRCRTRRANVDSTLAAAKFQIARIAIMTILMAKLGRLRDTSKKHRLQKSVRSDLWGERQPYEKNASSAKL